MIIILFEKGEIQTSRNNNMKMTDVVCRNDTALAEAAAIVCLRET